MRVVLVLLLVLPVLTLSGCREDSVTGVQVDEWKEDRIVMIDNPDDVPIYSDLAEITSAKIIGNTLVLHVIYGGGCKDHEFKLYGSKGFLESYPVQAVIWLSHNANGDLCEALISERLTFNLTPLKTEYRQGYYDNGPIMLRIYAPGSARHIEPLPVYRF